MTANGRGRAALGSLLFLVVVPGTVAGLGPWLLTRWESNDPPGALRLGGLALVIVGVAGLLQAFARFVLDGRGTPAPVAPTETLVVTGLYRYVRNPMYLAVGALIAGQGLLLGRPALMAYLAAFASAVVAFVRLYEEPSLAARFGAEYEAYRADVPRWLPRRTPWRPL